MVSSKKKWIVMNPMWRQMKQRMSSSRQNDQLVHWWLLVHSGLDYNIYQKRPGGFHERTS
jgi:hypothetical protein